jgi:anti-sigma regulatory factor (Ser/Thr protein kinase)
MCNGDWMSIGTETYRQILARRAREMLHRKALKRKRKNWHPRPARPLKECVRLPGSLETYSDVKLSQALTAFNQILENPKKILDFRSVGQISIPAGLILKGFFDEYEMIYHCKPLIIRPQDEKIRAVLKYLQLASCDVNCEQGPDIVCWNLFEWDQQQPSSAEEDIPILLVNDSIPDCLRDVTSRHLDQTQVASAVAEAFFNCREHAYQGPKANVRFQKWYLGFGTFPHTSHETVTFCIYDKGQGFRSSLQSKQRKIDTLIDAFSTDAALLEFAAKGLTGVREGGEKGRGKGLRTTADRVSQANGYFLILSDKGLYVESSSEGNPVGTKESRIANLQGSLIVFSFPVSYSNTGMSNDRKRE